MRRGERWDSSVIPSGLSRRPGFGLFCGTLLRLFEPVAFAIDGDDLGAVDQTVDERHHAGSIWEDLVPLSEDFVGCEDDGGVLLVASRDHLEEQVGVTGVV